VGAAIAARELGPAEAVFMLWIALFLGVLTSIAIIWPRTIAWPIAAIGFWIMMLLLVRAYKLKHRKPDV
jgi:cardiolipin synthase